MLKAFIRKISSYRKLEVAIVVLIFMLSAFRLWRALSGVWNELPSPDVQTYIQIANLMTHPFQSDHREPVWIWLVKIATTISGESNAFAAVRTLSVLAFATSGLLWYRLVRNRTSSPFIAILAYAIFALNNELIKLSARGLRDAGFFLGLVLWLGCLHRPPFSTRWGRAHIRSLIFSALSFVLVLGIRINSFMPMAAFYGYQVLRKRIDWREVAVIIGLGLLLFSPFLYFQNKEHGDPLYVINVAAPWYRNVEFVLVKKVGCPRCPTAEEVKINGYAGDKITPGQWIFGMHSPYEVASGTLQGYKRLFFERVHPISRSYFQLLSGSSKEPFYLLYCFGILVLFLLRLDQVIITTLLFANITPFLISAVDVDPRIFSAFAYWVALAIAFGATALCQIPFAAAYPWIARRDKAGAAKLSTFIFGSFRPAQSVRALINPRYFKLRSRF